MSLIADEKLLFESPSPQDIYCYTPALCRGFGGRIVAGFDLGGPGTEKLAGPRSDSGDYPCGNQLRILLSDDGGASWRESASRLPMLHAMLFRAGRFLYAIGQSGRLVISRSADNGESWSAPAVLESEHRWHQSAGRIDFRHGKLYLVYEQRIPEAPWPGVSPVLMAAREEADLCDPASWTFSEPFRAEALFDRLAAAGWRHRGGGVPGVLETSVIRIHDPDHAFFDPEDRTVLLLMRAETGSGNVGAVLKGVERPDGTLAVEPLESPAGSPLFLIPLPGGQLKFHIDYDPVSRLYWMVSSPKVDGCRKPGLPWYEACGDRRRLELFWSSNGLEFASAGMVAEGRGKLDSRHYASLLFDGDDLLVLARSGDCRAKTLHDGNLITLHRVRNFRERAK
ncbi:exo-alpha-sialidase [Victivallaceae bacterium BBE-744-WT-12]|uniref:Exo-alpha-sialidase n=1 Tax=Victivallis lenta TaxID=2606640 RepID=A0A844G4H2_9BACT|nr:sialidase family protein [Victivallis lenta]MST98256.1 exo-alpha-sialidase [Victivallis lenta]